MTKTKSEILELICNSDLKTRFSGVKSLAKIYRLEDFI